MTTDSKKRTTLKEVALHAQVSQAAASTVLSGRSNGIRVNPATEARIRESADAVGYRWRKNHVPKEAETRIEPMRQSVPGRRGSIASPLSPGIIARYSPMAIGSSADPWDDEVPAAFERTMADMVTVTSRYYNRWRFGEPNIGMDVAVGSLIKAGANALLIVDFDLVDIVSDYVPVLQSCGLPFVVVSSGPLHAPIANVCYDSRTAGFQAASHLMQQGHRQITFIAPEEADWVELRIDGIRAAMRQGGLSPDSLVIYPDERVPVIPNEPWGPVGERSYKIASKGFQDGAITSAVIAANDQVAMGVARAAKEAGRDLWKDFALIGFDDVAAARFLGISTVRAPRAEMGAEAAHILLRQWDGKRSNDLICLRSDVMVRASTSEWQARR